jgi:hypothetical protein
MRMDMKQNGVIWVALLALFLLGLFILDSSLRFGGYIL